MGNTGEDPDTMLVKKKSKKSLEEKGDLQKKGNKKRKRDSSSETTKIKEKDDEPAVEKDCHPKQKKEKKKKKHKQRHLENEESPDEVKNKKKKKKSIEKKSAEENSELQKKDKKKKKKKSLEENGDSQKKDSNKKRKRDSSSERTKIKEKDDEPAVEKDRQPKQKKEKKKKKHKQQQLENEESPDEVKNKKKKKKSIEKKSGEENSELQKKDKKRKKKKNLDTEMTEESADKVKKKKKKVSFADEVEMFPPSDKSESVKKKTGDNLIRGKRFTPEEDEIVKEAVKNYIIVNNLGDEGLNMVLHCKLHKGLRKCWKDIATCIPYRPYSAVYYRAHILFEGGDYGKWTEEEKEFLKESYKKHGNNWKMVAEELGKHRFHVKDAWRRISLETLKPGKWSREEYQGLYDLVNLDLKMKLTQEKQSKHGMLRDNIPWGSISEKLTTRTNVGCCKKWYKQLTSSLVAEKKWCDADDYWLIGALYDVDAACVEDVDWDSLLAHRDGEVCRKRWYQMVRCIEDRKGMPFQQQVDILAKRYHPEMAETRQDWDDKPRVP